MLRQTALRSITLLTFLLPYGEFIAYIVENIYKPLNIGNLQCLAKIAKNIKAYTDDNGNIRIKGE